MILAETELSMHTKLYTTNIGNIIVRVEVEPVEIWADLNIIVSTNGVIQLRESYLGSVISLDKSLAAVHAVFNTLNGEEDYNGDSKKRNDIIYS